MSTSAAPIEKQDEMTRLNPTIPTPQGGHGGADFKPQTTLLSLCLAPIGLVFCPLSMYVLNPNQNAVVLQCGTLVDIATTPGCHYANCCGRDLRIVSSAQTSFDLPSQKILDRTGNPLIVSAILSYRFLDPIAAALNVENGPVYVHNQATATLKQVLGKFSYEELKNEGAEVSEELLKALQPRINVAGATASSFTLNELNYAPEIAGAMLKKQQAHALVEARHLIVQGAVEICQSAVKALEAGGVELSHEEKVRIITNLLTVTTGDKDASPTLALQ